MTQSWRRVTIGDLATVVRGASPRPKGDPRYFGGEIPWIAISDVTRAPGRILLKTAEGVTRAGAERSRLLPKGTLILTNSGTVGVPKVLGMEGCIHDGFVAFTELSPEVDREFLYEFFRWQRPFLIEKHRQGMTQVNLNTDIVRSIQIALPPIDVQRRIVAKLDELLAQSRAVREQLEAVPALVEQYRQSMLAAAVSGRLSSDEIGSRGRACALSDAIVSLDQGWSPKCDPRPAQSDAEWAVIKTTSVQPLQFVAAENKRLPVQLAPREALEIVAGDVLITRAGPRSRAGVTCAVSNTRPRLMICDKVYRLRTKAELLDPAYLACWLNAPAALTALDAMKTGISESGVNLTQVKLLSLPVVLPPLAEQRRLVDVVTRSLAGVGRAADLASIDRDADALERALLAKAFRGELALAESEGQPRR
ncbi:MAG: restriction endonuclease subunit S [Myxococcota bacterium]